MSHQAPFGEKRPGFDDANAEPGSGASGPGTRGYEGESGVGDVGGEAEVALEDRAEEVAAGGVDPAVANARPERVADGEVLPADADEAGGARTDDRT